MKQITNPKEQKKWLESIIAAHRSRLVSAGIDTTDLPLIVEGEIAELFGIPAQEREVRSNKPIGEIVGTPVIHSHYNEGIPYAFLGAFMSRCCGEGRKGLRTYGDGEWMHEFFYGEPRAIRFCPFCGRKLRVNFPTMQGPEWIYDKLAIFNETER
jgi:hypothetical protein